MKDFKVHGCAPDFDRGFVNVCRRELAVLLDTLDLLSSLALINVNPKDILVRTKRCFHFTINV